MEGNTENGPSHRSGDLRQQLDLEDTADRALHESPGCVEVDFDFLPLLGKICYSPSFFAFLYSLWVIPAMEKIQLFLCPFLDVPRIQGQRGEFLEVLPIFHLTKVRVWVESECGPMGVFGWIRTRKPLDGPMLGHVGSSTVSHPSAAVDQ